MLFIVKGVILLYESISRLPIKYLYFIGNLISILNYIPYNGIRNRITHNLKIIFPSISIQKMKLIRRRIFQSIGQYAAEFIKFINNNEEVKIDVQNPEILEQSIRNNNITICLSGHFTGFEFFTTIPENFKTGNFIFIFEKDPNYDIFNSWISKKRDRGGGYTISSKEAYRFLLNKLVNDNHLVVGSLSDLAPKLNSSTGIFQFLNKKRRVYTGMQRVGCKLGAHFLYVYIKRKGKGNYLLRFYDIPPTTAEEVTDTYLKLLERNIIESPELWLPLIMYKL